MNRGYLGTVCLALLGQTWAQPASFDASVGQTPAEVVLTPARVGQPQSEAPASVTVIDRELIEASGAREIFELMRLVPGMAAVKVDGNVPSVSYHPTQASDLRRMLVLLDGRSQYQPGLARVNWNDIPVDLADVERIEVTRGPAAAAYGANAFTGVINIITRDPRDLDRQSLMVRGGNNGIRDGRITVGGHWQQGAWRTSLSRLADHGYDGEFQGRSLRDAKRVERLNSEWVWESDSRNTYTIQAGGSHGWLERPDEKGVKQFGDYVRRPVQESQRAFLGSQWQHAFNEKHQLKVSAYGQFSEEVNDFRVCYRDPFTGNPGPGGGILFSRELRDLYLAQGSDISATVAAAPSDPAVQNRYAVLQGLSSPFCAEGRLDIREQRYDLEIQDTLDLGQGARLVSGLNVRHDRADSQAYLSGTQNNTSYRAFGNLSLPLTKTVIANLGGYWERDQINGQHFSPRAGINWRVLPGHHLRYVYSRAVRTPDIYENRADINIRAYELEGGFANNAKGTLGWSRPLSFITQVSDRSLQAERIRSWELGYYGRFASVDLDLRYFQEKLTDLLSDPLNPYEFSLNNDGKVTHRGTEVQLSWAPHPAHTLRLAGAHIHTWSNDNTERRLNMRDSVSALWSWRINRRWQWTSNYYLARRYNDHPLEQLNLQLRFKQGLGPHEVEWRLMWQHRLDNHPVVFPENRYQHDRAWIGAEVRF